MKPQFQLGEQLAYGLDFTGRLESIFLDAESAYSAQISWRRLRLRHKLPPPRLVRRREPRVGEPPTQIQIHLFLVAPGRRLGAFVPEVQARRLVGAPAATAKTRYHLGQWLIEPYGEPVMVSAIHRRFLSAVDCGVVRADWFDAQERRPSTRLQPFYGCGGVLVGEAEARPWRGSPPPGRARS